MNRKNKLLLIFMIATAIIFIYIISSKSKVISIEYISNETHTILPNEAKLLFYKRVTSFNMDSFYIKFQISKKIWQSYSKNQMFKNLKNKNIFSSLDIVYENWNPKAITNSLSGDYSFDYATDFITLKYLFDISNAITVDCYFAIFIC